MSLIAGSWSNNQRYDGPSMIANRLVIVDVHCHRRDTHRVLLE
jgi:hypothetical protein